MNLCANCAEYHRHDSTHGVCPYRDGKRRWNDLACAMYRDRSELHRIKQEMTRAAIERRHRREAKKCLPLPADDEDDELRDH